MSWFTVKNKIVLMLKAAWEMSQLRIPLGIYASGVAVIKALELPLCRIGRVDRLPDVAARSQNARCVPSGLDNSLVMEGVNCKLILILSTLLKICFPARSTKWLT